MDTENGGSPLDQHRAFRQAFEDHPDQTLRWEADTAQRLVGLGGEVLSIPRDEWSDRYSWDPSLTPHTDLATDVVNFQDQVQHPDDRYSATVSEAGIRILCLLANRHAIEAGEAFGAAIDQMIEPIRTVAVARLVYGTPEEEIAEHLQLPVETVDFLARVALHELEDLIEIRSPRVRRQPRTNDENLLPDDATRPFDVPLR